MQTFLHHPEYGDRLFHNLNVDKAIFDAGWRDSPDRFGQSAEDAWKQWIEEKGTQIRASMVESPVEAMPEPVPEPEPVETVEEEIEKVEEDIDEIVDSFNKTELLQELRNRNLPGNGQENKSILAERLKKAIRDEAAEQ